MILFFLHECMISRPFSSCAIPCDSSPTHSQNFNSQKQQYIISGTLPQLRTSCDPCTERNSCCQFAEFLIQKKQHSSRQHHINCSTDRCHPNRNCCNSTDQYYTDCRQHQQVQKKSSQRNLSIDSQHDRKSRHLHSYRRYQCFHNGCRQTILHSNASCQYRCHYTKSGNSPKRQPKSTVVQICRCIQK